MSADKGKFSLVFRHYFLNTLIILFTLVSGFLIYNFLFQLTAEKPEIRTQQIDSTTYLTRQSSGGTLQIDVQNGCGVSGIADKFTDYLRAKGFDVVEMGNFLNQDIKTTIIIDRTGNRNNALRVAQVLGVSPKNVIQQVNRNYFLDATVVIGKDYSELLPFRQHENGKP